MTAFTFKVYDTPFTISGKTLLKEPSPKASLFPHPASLLYSASESETDSDDDTTWLKPKARQLQRSSLTVRDPTEQRNSQPVDTCHAEDDMPPLLHIRGVHNGEPFTAGIGQIDIHSDLPPLVNDTSDDEDDYVGPFTTSAIRGVQHTTPSASMDRPITSELKNRSNHCSRLVLPNPVSPQKPKVVSLGAMTANSINNDGTGEINILPTRGVRESPPSNVANTVDNI